MTITAALCWYAETPETLSRCVKSLSGYCDRLVAFGGRWDGFPSVPGDDTGVQIKAIMSSCEIDWNVYYDPLFDSQVEKRAEMMETASVDSDWVLVIDADEYIAEGDPEEFRAGLEQTDLDVARVYAYRVPMAYGRLIRRAYRTNPGFVTVKVAHNGYVSSDGRFLHGDLAYCDLEPAVDLGDTVRIAHDLTCRDQTRKNARAAYLQFRRSGRVEVWA